MAKIFKISGYLVDPDDLYRLSEIYAGISYALDGMLHQHIHVEEFGKWIPCSERMPEKPRANYYDGYIVQTRHVMQPFSAYWDGIEWTDDDDDAVDDVIAWMPLPEPHREKE